MVPTPVIAAIIYNNQNRILICQRKNGALAAKWEFPGGKIEPGETPEQCLVREIQEELSIDIEVTNIFKAVNSHYEHGDFLLIAYQAQYISGEISLHVHQDYAWIEPWRLMDYDLAAANIPIACELKEQAHPAGTSVGSDSRTY